MSNIVCPAPGCYQCVPIDNKITDFPILRERSVPKQKNEHHTGGIGADGRALRWKCTPWPTCTPLGCRPRPPCTCKDRLTGGEDLLCRECLFENMFFSRKGKKKFTLEEIKFLNKLKSLEEKRILQAMNAPVDANTAFEAFLNLGGSKGLQTLESFIQQNAIRNYINRQDFNDLDQMIAESFSSPAICPDRFL